MPTFPCFQINKPSYFSVVSFFLLFSVLFFNTAQAEDLLLNQEQSSIQLEEGLGVFLIHLDVSGSAPSMRFSQISAGGLDYLKSDQKVNFYFFETYDVNLKGLENGFYWAILPEGLYQITQVNAPYFDFPFKLDTQNRSVWRFKIEAQRTNYVGSLYIDEERSSSSVQIFLRNRIAAQLSEINATHHLMTARYPLALGSGYEDQYLTVLDEYSGLQK